VITLLHAIVYVFLYNLLNVLIQIANKIGLQNKIASRLTIKCVGLDVSQIYGPPLPVTGVVSLILYGSLLTFTKCSQRYISHLHESITTMPMEIKGTSAVLR
jgi:hypothetical protein